MIDDKYKTWSGTLQPVLDELTERPIAPQRWQAYQSQFNRALNERVASLKGTENAPGSPEEALQYEARQAVALTVNGLSIPAKMYDFSDFTRVQQFVMEHARNTVNNLVTEAVLGPGWRESAAEDTEEVAESYEGHWIAALDLSRVLRCIQDEGELEIILGRMLEESWSETARRLGKDDSTLRKQWERLRAKLKKI